MRKTIASVTCFLHCHDDYLFVHRTKKGKSVDAGRLNGIGGKLEPNEDYLAAAIRETKEETGYEVSVKDCRLSAFVRLSGAYAEDWIMAFIVISVPSKDIPIGTENDEGQLLWLHKDAVLSSPYEKVDDLHYCWDDICDPAKQFFASAVVDNNEKIAEWNASELTVVPVQLS